MFGGIFGKYYRLLHLYPYSTQSLTAGAMWFAGDILTQKLCEEKLDWRRIAIMTSFGVGCAGPLYTWWYARVLDKLSRNILHKIIRVKYSKPTAGNTDYDKDSVWKVIGIKGGHQVNSLHSTPSQFVY
jgi:hypothetical protein